MKSPFIESSSHPLSSRSECGFSAPHDPPMCTRAEVPAPNARSPHHGRERKKEPRSASVQSPQQWEKQRRMIRIAPINCFSPYKFTRVSFLPKSWLWDRLPTAAQCLVQGDKINRLCGPALGQEVFIGVKFALGIEH